MSGDLALTKDLFTVLAHEPDLAEPSRARLVIHPKM